MITIHVSEGAIANALARLAERARPSYEAIGARVRAGPAIGSDETSARVRGRNWWQWILLRGLPDADRQLSHRAERRHPSRDTVIRLGLAMQLSMEDMDELLLAAGYAPLVR